MATGEMTRRRARTALGSPRRLVLLRALQVSGPSTVGELAQAAGLHENTAREHLQRLIDEGYVRCDRGVPEGRGRPPLRYRTVSGEDLRDDPEAAARLEGAIAQAAVVRTVLDDGSGRRDDVALGQVDRQVLALEAHLDRVGLDPVLDPETFAIHLWRCPFLAVAAEAPEVVCAVHLGLAEEVLAQVGGPVRAAELQPFVGPGHCVLRLAVHPED